MEKQKFNITGMTCSACSAHVEKAVSKLEGVKNASVNLLANSMTAEFDEGILSAQDIIQAVIQSGYGASLPEKTGTRAQAAPKEDAMAQELAGMKHRMVWSFVFLIPLFYISMGHMMGAPLPAFLVGHENAVAFGLTQLLLTLPIMYLNDKYYKVGFKTLWNRAPNMDSLIAVGSAASINKSGFFTFEASRVGEDTTLAQMIRLVEEASASKAPIAKLADKVSGIFVPVVMAIALIAAAAWLVTGHGATQALTAGVAVLVISCPCALGLATPVAIMVGTGKGAENGILIKSAEALELLHTVDTVVLDKTGTLTQGKPVVTDILPVYAPQVKEDDLLWIAYCLEKPSEHPLAAAIVEEAERRGLSLAPVNGFEAIHGRGVRAELGDHIRFGGNRAMMEEAGIDLGEWAAKADELAAQGKTPLYFGDETEKKLLGIIAVADTPKPSSRDAVAAFRELGLEVVMLTGDNQRTADAIGKELGVSSVLAEVLPQDKERKVAALQDEGKKVAMVGDGINDAPALARADVGLAIGAGTDVAIESADIVLMKSDLLDVAAAVELSRATIRNIKQNLFWAFFYNSLGIPLAAGVFYYALQWQLNPMFAAAAMSLSSVTVVTNALRLRFFKSKFRSDTPAAPACGGSCPLELKDKPNQGGDKTMNKTMIIEGMMCAHCTGRVEKALAAIDGVTAVEMSLEGKSAALTLSKDVDNQVLTDAVTQAGYEVVSVQ